MPVDSPFSAIKQSDRMLVVGKTESGKTYLVRYATRRVPCLIVCDPKGLIKEKEWNLIPWRDGYRDLMRGRDVRVRIPSQDAPEDWEEYLWEVYNLPWKRKGRPFVLYIDELYGVGPAQGSRALQALYTRGRELGIFMIASTQRPKRIPPYALSEAEILVLFQTRMPQDIELMSELIPDLWGLTDNGTRPLTEHQFVVYNIRGDRAARYERLQVVSGPVSLG